MRLKEKTTTDKLRGGYYTPDDIAEYIVRWGMAGIPVRKVLEPSCGDGVFLKFIRDYTNQSVYECCAIELVGEESLKASNSIRGTDQIRVINDDFYKVYEEKIKNEKFDLIVGNPPYIRYQYLTEQQRNEQSLILTSNGMKSNKLINAWVSFVVACVEMMSVKSRIGLVIPAELLQVAYAEDLRKYLMKHLQRITIITFRELVFADVEQEVVILLGEKDDEHLFEHQIRMLEFQNIKEMRSSTTIDAPFQDIEMDGSKWTQYFLSDTENHAISHVRTDTRFVRFKKIASADIGITTGNNNYFCVNKSTVEDPMFRLNELIEAPGGHAYNPLKPLIARSVSIRGIKFTEEDWQFNIDRGAKTYLLSYPSELSVECYPNGHQNYIKHGEKQEEHIGYKCSIRKQWYSIPSIWSPDAFFLRRNHLYPKLVLNTELNAVSTDTMHRIKINEGVNPELLLIAYYNSIGLAFTEIEGRSYGGGVLEILPGELENIMLPNVFQTNLMNHQQISELVSVIDQQVREFDDILEVLDYVDRVLLIELLGLEESLVSEFRNIWLSLRKRRLGRGK